MDDHELVNFMCDQSIMSYQGFVLSKPERGPQEYALAVCSSCAHCAWKPGCSVVPAEVAFYSTLFYTGVYNTLQLLHSTLG